MTTPTTEREAAYMSMFGAACVDLGLINKALGLDPNDGGAAPILAAIKEMKVAALAKPVQSAEQGDAKDAERYRVLRPFIHLHFDRTRKEVRGVMDFWCAAAALPASVDELVDGLGEATAMLARNGGPV